MKHQSGYRVLMLIENGPYSWDGRVRREANTLTAAGCQVTVICRQGPGEGWCVEYGRVTAYQYPGPPSVNGFVGYALEYAYALTATMALSLWIAVRRGFDVVHAHNPPDLFVLIGLFYKLFGKRFVFDHHDLAPEMYLVRFSGRGNPLVYRSLLFFERLSCRLADQVIAANDSYKRIAIERSGIAADRIAVVRNGPEPCHLQRSEPDPKLSGDPRPLIGFVGDMSDHDGIDHLLRALAHLKNELGRCDWRCVLVGDGDAAASLKQLATELGISDHLSLTGWLDYRAVPRFIAAMDICVAPDPANGYSDLSTIVKLMEYMAQSKPMVLFDLPEHHVTAGDAALYAVANDERDFARHLATLMDDTELRRRLGEEGRARVVNSLAWSHQERRLLTAYQKLLSPPLMLTESASRREGG
jgi:glycosyltransferase involved in cell wall biosynthesis